MEIIKTLCQGCYFYCGLDVARREGKIVRIQGTAEHPVNRGSICVKGLSSQQLVTDGRRLRTPLLRAGNRGSGNWTEIPWHEAMEILVERLSETRSQHGPEAVAFHRGHAPGWVTALNYAWRFMNSFGSPNLLTHAHLCFAPRAIAHAATYGGVPEPDFDQAKCILLWGFNPVDTSLPNYARRIIDAKARGACLIVVDPRYSKTAAKADLWLQPFPGTDLALAMGMVKVIIDDDLYDAAFVASLTLGFDQLQDHVAEIDLGEVSQITGISVAQIREAARLFCEQSPAVLKEGNGLDQHTNVVQTVRAVALITALTGNINVEGGGVLVPPLPFVDVQARSRRGEDWQERSISTHPLYYGTGNSLNDEELFASLETGVPYAIRSLIVQGGALVSANSNTERTLRLLRKLDFIAVHDLYKTATAEIADLVFPAASFLERTLLLYYRYRPAADVNMVGLQQQVVSPIGESRSDLQFIFDLAKGLGMDEQFPWETPEEAFEWELEPLGIGLQDLRGSSGGYRRTYSPAELYRTHGRSGFNTPSGKVELASSRFRQHGHDAIPSFSHLPDLLSPSDEYPFVCGTGLKLGVHTHTQFHTLPWIESLVPERVVEINPQAAGRLEIAPGDMVSIESRWGAIKARAVFSEALAETVVMLAYGFGQPYAGCQWHSANDITPHVLPDGISGATSNRRVPVRVVPVATEQTRSPGRNLALVASTERCVACLTCEVACQQEHGGQRIQIHLLGPTPDHDGRMRSEAVPLATSGCDLCAGRVVRGDDPCCVAACPTMALSLVTIDEAINYLRQGGFQLAAIRTVGETKQAPRS